MGRLLCKKSSAESYPFVVDEERERENLAQKDGMGSVNNTITHRCEELIGLGNIYHVTLTSRE
jgi:hypothetical protein